MEKAQRPYIHEQPDRIHKIPKLPSSGDIAHPAIKQIMPALEAGLSDMRENILKGKYSFIIGDDISGRIPTLIIRGVISHVYTHSCRQSLPAVFIKENSNALSSHNKTLLTSYLSKTTQSTEKPRAVIVTEFISSGKHIKNISTVLSENDIESDVFALSTWKDISYYRRTNVISPTENLYPLHGMIPNCPTIYAFRAITGYEQNEYGEVSFSPEYKEQFKYARNDVRSAISTLANTVFT